MAKFKFIGGGEDSPKSVTAFGKAFELNGDAVEVTDKATIEKLSTNQNFIKSGEKPEKGQGAQLSAEETRLTALKPAELQAEYKAAGFPGKASKEEMIEAIHQKNVSRKAGV